MNESEQVEVALPELHCVEHPRVEHPRGGAVAWALLVAGLTLAAGILLAVIWATGAAW